MSSSLSTDGSETSSKRFHVVSLPSPLFFSFRFPMSVFLDLFLPMTFTALHAVLQHVFIHP